MFIRFAVAISLSLTLAYPAPLGGQSSQPAPGSRVRLTTMAGPRVEGRLVAMGTDSLILLGDGGQVSVPRSGVSTLESWRGRTSQWRSGAEIGSFLGLATASVIFAARMRNCVGLACAKSLSWDAYAWAGAWPGALVGGLVGALVHKDRWERVPLGPLHPQVAFQAGDQGVGVSIRF